MAIWEAQIAHLGIPYTSHIYRGPSLYMWELQPNLPPIGPIMYWKQLDPMGLGKGLTEVPYLIE
jgi:hypothetical protein